MLKLTYSKPRDIRLFFKQSYPQQVVLKIKNSPIIFVILVIFLLSFIILTIVTPTPFQSAKNELNKNENIPDSNVPVNLDLNEPLAENLDSNSSINGIRINDGNKIENIIYEQLQETEWVLIIIELKDDNNIYQPLELRRENIKKSQDRLLKLLENNFQLQYRLSILFGLTGRINLKGIEILRNDKEVTAVYAERILSTN